MKVLKSKHTATGWVIYTYGFGIRDDHKEPRAPHTIRIPEQTSQMIMSNSSRIVWNAWSWCRGGG